MITKKTQKILLGIVFQVLILSSMYTCVRAETFSATIPALEIYSLSATYSDGDVISFDLTATDTVSAALVDEANYNTFIKNFSGSGYALGEGASFSKEYEIPAAGKWFILVFNPHLTSTQVNIELTVSNPATTTTYVIVVLVIIGLCVFCLIRRKRKRAATA